MRNLCGDIKEALDYQVTHGHLHPAEKILAVLDNMVIERTRAAGRHAEEQIAQEMQEILHRLQEHRSWFEKKHIS